jgi:DNA-directed RNA polymerase beta subunit
MNKSGGTNATVAIYSQGLVIGDKLATYYGIKFTIGEKVPYKDMPAIMDKKTGKKFKPSVLI